MIRRSAADCEAESPPRPFGRIGAQVGSAAVLVWVVGLVRFRSWIATGDLAILQLRLERMGSGHIPLTGAFSRLDFHHPGPAREWIIGLAYHVSGGRSAALPATSIVINLAFAGAALLMAHRAGRSNGLALAALGLIAVHVGLGFQLHSAWNPYLAVLAGYAALWGCIAAIVDGGRTWVLPIVAASFMAQLHASALLAGGTLIAVVITQLVGQPAPGVRRSRRLGPALLLTIGLWSGPLLDLLQGEDSNPARMLRATDGAKLGAPAAVDATARLLLPWSHWRGETSTPPGPLPDGWSPLVVIALIALALTWAWARSRRHRLLGAMSAMAIVSTVVTTASFALFTEPAPFYLFAPVSALLLAPGLTGLELARVVIARVWTVSCGRVSAIASVALVTLAGLATTQAWTVLEPIVSSPLERGVEGAVARVVEPGRRYTIVSAGMLGASTEGDVALAVQRHGARPRSSQFSLDLPGPTPGSPTFAVAMTAPLACLDEVTLPSEVVVRAVSVNVGLPVGVFLVDSDRWHEVRECLGENDFRDESE